MEANKEFPKQQRKQQEPQNLNRSRLHHQSPLGPHAKERWLLTRKTWRYMTDTVGNFLPLEYRQVGQVGPGPSSVSSGGGGSFGSSKSTVHQQVSGGDQCGEKGGQQRVTTSIGTQSSPETIKQMRAGAEQSFSKACDNQKHFLIWTRNRGTPLSGPALQEQRLLARAEAAKRKNSTSGATDDSSLRAMSPSTSTTTATTTRTDYDDDEDDDDEIWLERDEYDEYDDDDEVITVRERKSSIQAGSAGVDSGGDGAETGEGCSISEPGTTESFSVPDDDSRVYVSVGTQTEGFSDPVFPPYALQHMQQFPQGALTPGYGVLPYYFTTNRRISIDSAAGGGGGAMTTSSSETQETMSSSTSGSRFYEGHQAQPYHQYPDDFIPSLSYPSATSSDSVARFPIGYEYKAQPKKAKANSSDSSSCAASDIPSLPAGTVSDPGPYPHQRIGQIGGLRRNLVHPPSAAHSPGGDQSSSTTTVKDSSSPQTSNDQLRQRETCVISGTSGPGATNSISSESVAAATCSGETIPTTSTTSTSSTAAAGTDKKSEESGYSSSISDTVMRYLKMARKNSKTDKKDIDRFKTVNYDRSLRNIKSKNVTIEEALEHDRNKAAAAANGTAPHQPTAAEEFSAQIASNQLEKLQEEYCQRIGITSVSTPPLPSGATASTPIQVGKLPKEALKSGGGQPGGPPGGPPPKRLLPSVGIQAGESIIKFLKMFNRRKQSDLSSPSYPSSESNVDTVTSPRSSLATTIMSTSGSDPDMYPILFSSREMSAAFSPRASFDTVIYDENQEFDDVFTSSCSTSPPVLHQSFMPSYNVVVPGKIPNPQSPLSVANLFPSLRLSSRKGSVPDTAVQQLQSGFPIKVKSASSTKHSSSVLSPLTQTIRRSSNSYSNVQDARGGHHHGHHHHQVIPASSSLSSKTPKSKSDDISMLYGGGVGGGGHSLKYTSAGGQYIHNMGHEARIATSSGAENPYSSPGPTSSDLKHGLQQQQQLTQQQMLIQQQMLMQMQQQYSSSSSSPRKSKSSNVIPRTSSADQHAAAAALVSAGGSSNSSTNSSKPRKGSIGGGQNIMKRLFSSQSKKSDSDKDSVVGYGGEESVRVMSAGGTNAALLQTMVGGGGGGASGVIFGGVGVGGGLNSGHGQVQQQQQLLYSTTITSDRDGDKYESRNDSIGGGDGTTCFTTSDSRPLSRGSGGGSTKSNRNECVSVMQKSKSSSSVLHHPSSSSSEKSYSTQRSRTKLFHKHKKEKEVVNVPKPSNWAPQAEPGVWTSLLSGRQIVLEPTLVQKLSEPERLALQKLSLQKLRTQNLGVDVKIPREKTNIGSSGTKAKRRPYLLKKKALSTGFFDSGKRDDLSKEGGNGLVFSISLSECVKNDLERRQGVEASEGLSTINLAATQVGSKTHDTSRQSISSDLSNSDKQVSPTPGSKYGADERHRDTSNSGEFGQVPVLVQECVRHLEKYGLHTTGIFRVGSSLKRTRQLREEIDAGREIKLGEEHSPHDVATLLKEFLRDLPEPLLCRDLYNAFLKAPKLRNRKSQMECMQNLINLLPVANRDTLFTLLSLFAKVVDNSQDVRMKTGEILTGNKMEAYSLATLIAPNILPCLRPDGTSGSEEQQAAQTRERRDSIDVVSYLIANYRDLFTVTPETLNEVYMDLLDTNPEVVENIIRTKFPAATQEIEDLESGIITFRSSQYGDSGDDSDPRRGSFKRREIVFHDFIGGGNGRTSRSGSRHEIFAFARDDDGKESGGCHSGGESDSSSSKSTSRWFRKSKNTEHKSRASSDSGSDKVHTSKSKSKDFVIDGNKRANSLDSVNMVKEVGRGIIAISDVPPTTSAPTDRLRSSSDQALKIPVDMNRRQSSPMLESRIINERGERERSGNQGGVIKASLKFTVPMNIDDTDIPFIEEDNSEGHSLHSRRGHTPTHGATSPVDDVGGGSFPYEEIEARICLGVPSNDYHRRMSAAAAGQISPDKKSPGMPRVGSQGSLGSVSESKTVRHLMPHLKPQDPKTTGKETKGANITGIIKSKTADFEKLASKSMGGVFHPSKGRKSSDTKSSSGELDKVATTSPSPKQGSNSSLAKATEKEVPSPVPGRLAKSDSSKSVSGGVPGTGTVWKRSEIISSPMRKKKGS